MITETGRVLQVEGEWALVACRRQVECARCAAGRGCGGGVLGKLLGDRLHQVRAATGAVPVTPGDRVLIGLSEDAVLRAAAAVYLVPLLAALAGGVALGLVLPGGELGAVAGAGLGLVLGLRWARGYGERHGADATLQPVVLGLSDGERCAGGEA
ncbi:SoxR reducing system RseC family protein [Thioalkalivibrio sp. XN279]|uniref:SoxR reducing system RseC family protein n=1 Tax=Thioalkalivibrio sp. XN279 TaxID=2714953 RepID=UPI00140E6489|nr:SoxR reducing system RseC family protein [Thioalkalivibrio sp. XN279]NHA15257.1 SoxR reducing system RseC family protein [Thioalkalivibrio sp. XN279]